MMPAHYRKLLALLLGLILGQQTYCQQLHFAPCNVIPEASFRGLSVIDNHTAWVSGSKGWLGRTIDGGESWQFKQVAGYETKDFRSVYAFDSLNVIIANAGSPASILRTTNGGASWGKVYENSDTAAFFDGICFWNDREGIIYGDPLNGRLMLLHTKDGGATWQEFPEDSRPRLSEGEASFAASGTCIRCLGREKVVIATGGKVSGLLVSVDKGNNWKRLQVPIIQGIATTGIFSIAFLNNKSGVITGGDYKKESLKTDHVFYTRDRGKSWVAPPKPTGGYRECVEFLTDDLVVATGPDGTDISYDAGMNWQAVQEKGYHVIRKSRKGNLVIFAGNGKIAVATVE